MTTGTETGPWHHRSSPMLKSGCEVLLQIPITYFMPDPLVVVVAEQLSLNGRGADGVGVKRATIYGGYSPRSGRPGFESQTQRHLPNVSPSLYPSFLSTYCQK
ncbi:hypothetical protein XENORESO_008358 [Xenotaenia resolanae]|uniref:Uncharacterized protein n=1 Tax=Xenotaenia resolanae TaxID=208358 RepID=A0ABV0W3X0_9TELE